MPRMLPRLDSLSVDVWHCILREIAALPDSGPMENLSSTSRAIRSHCMPYLFHTCTGRYFLYRQIPPENIRPYVRHIHYTGTFLTLDDLIDCGYYDGYRLSDTFDMADPLERDDSVMQSFGVELDYFPNANAVSFDLAGGVPWSALMKCFEYPNVTSVFIDADSTWMGVPPPATSDLLGKRCRLTRFSYTPSVWRDAEGAAWGSNMQSRYALEASYLHALVPNMSDTAEALSLPVETSPLMEMATRDWPRLRSLSLSGRYMHPDQSRALSLLLLRAPNLRDLSIRVMQQRENLRPLLLETPSVGRYRLRSLTLAYPNPADAIFASLSDELTSLSLRDAPRYYMYQSHDIMLPPDIASPLLSSSECLTILRRISAPRLTTLELVYRADEAEDDLLRHLADAFPLIEELELHRYSASKGDDIPYMRIAHILRTMKSLRAAYLNFDPVATTIRHPAVVAEPSVWDRYLDKLIARGFEIVAALEGGTHFERVALLFHARYAGTWILFRPTTWPCDCRIDYYSRYNLDSAAPRVDKRIVL